MGKLLNEAKVLRSGLGCLKQRAGVFGGFSSSKHSAPGYKQLRTCFDHGIDGIVSNAAVDLDFEVQAQFRAQLAKAANLGEGVGDELLAAEAGVDAHDEHVVQHGQHGQEQVNRGVRV